MCQSKNRILEIVNEYNFLMKDAIVGPNCIDPRICHADCCHIQIDIPRVLAEYYIEKGFATKKDFTRGNLFSFHINIKPSNSKCVFYDRELNGCSLHKTMHKPPQCWIYPTGFSPEPGEEKQFAENGSIRCKKTSGWKIIDVQKTNKAKLLFDEYVEYCENEFIRETLRDRIKKRLESVFSKMEDCAPKSIAGVIDGWDHFSILKAEGISLKLKSLCDQIPEANCTSDYMECTHVCDEIIDLLRRDLLDNVIYYIETKGAKSSYSFLELWHVK